MRNDEKGTAPRQSPRKSRPAISAVLDDGALVELLYDPSKCQTRFAIWKNGVLGFAKVIALPSGEQLIPYSPGNNLIKNNVVLFASEPENFHSDERLLQDIQAYLHRYVDLSPRFERLTSYYVLLTWVYDCFNELPYLRLRGDYGSGKTRFLLTLGSICYKPIFASGASSLSPIFRILDAFGGTLIIDEGDFRFSDEKADIIKILNGGNVRGLPLLKTEVSKSGEFNPRAFNIYGPKVAATRGFYQDRALESRFITEQTGGRKLRRDIPINLPPKQREEALSLRNKLLLYRFTHFSSAGVTEEMADPDIEPRLNQVFAPLLSVVSSEQAREELRSTARQHHHELIAERGMDVEAQVLSTIHELIAAEERTNLPIKDIAEAFVRRHGDELTGKITNQWIGGIVRRRLQLKTYKSHGNYVIPLTEQPKLRRLFERYGITAPSVDMGDAGDAPADAAPRSQEAA